MRIFKIQRRVNDDCKRIRLPVLIAECSYWLNSSIFVDLVLIFLKVRRTLQLFQIRTTIQK